MSTAKLNPTDLDALIEALRLETSSPDHSWTDWSVNESPAAKAILASPREGQPALAVAAMHVWASADTGDDQRVAFGWVVRQIASRRISWTDAQLAEVLRCLNARLQVAAPFFHGDPTKAVLRVVSRQHGASIPKQLHSVLEELQTTVLTPKTVWGVYEEHREIARELEKMLHADTMVPSLGTDDWAELLRERAAALPREEALAILAFAGRGRSALPPKAFEAELGQLVELFGSGIPFGADALLRQIASTEPGAIDSNMPSGTADVVVGLVWIVGLSNDPNRTSTLAMAAEWGWHKVPYLGAPCGRAARAAAMQLARSADGIEMLQALAEGGARSPSAQKLLVETLEAAAG